MIFQLLPLLCGLAAISFSSCIKSPRQAIFLLPGFILGQAIISFGPANPFVAIMVSPQELAIVAAVSAMLLLRHHDWRHFGLILAGFMAAFWVATLQNMGAPFMLGLLVGLLAIGVTLWAILFREGFINDGILDEALLLVFLLGLIVGLVPELIGGWQSAGALQALDASDGGERSGFAALLVALAFTVLGVFWAFWRGRRSQQN